MKTTLLRKVVRFCEEEPRRFNMSIWYQDVGSVLKGDDETLARVNEATAGVDQPDEISKDQIAPCGIIGCLAGNTCIVTGLCETEPDSSDPDLIHYYEPGHGWFRAAKEALGLTGIQAERLFYPSKEFNEGGGRPGAGHWPERYSLAYRKAKTPEERVKVLRRRVEHFIKTNGRE